MVGPHSATTAPWRPPEQTTRAHRPGLACRQRHLRSPAVGSAQTGQDALSAHAVGTSGCPIKQRCTSARPSLPPTFFCAAWPWGLCKEDKKRCLHTVSIGSSLTCRDVARHCTSWGLSLYAASRAHEARGRSVVRRSKAALAQRARCLSEHFEVTLGGSQSLRSSSSLAHSVLAPNRLPAAHDSQHPHKCSTQTCPDPPSLCTT